MNLIREVKERVDIVKVAEYYGHDRENTVAFGDGENDITYLLRDLLPKGFGPENIK